MSSENQGSEKKVSENNTDQNNLSPQPHTLSWRDKLDIKGGVKTSALVGTTLTVINQWEALISTEPFSIGAFVLTLLVPFCVYQYGRITS